MFALMLTSWSLCLPAHAAMRGEVHFVPSAAEAAVPERFRLKEATFPFEMEQRRHTSRYTVWSVRFPSPVETGEDANNQVYGEYFQPVGADGEKRCPAVVVLHILGADFALSRFMAARLADHGVAALFIQLPYYGERSGPGRRSAVDSARRILASLSQGVCDVRRAVAWLANRPEVDSKRLGVTGISLGGIVSAVAAAVDPAVDRAALLLAGGGLADVLWDLPESAAFRTFWLAAGRTKAQFGALVSAYDPITYAAGLRDKRVLMLAADVDEVIPPRAAMALWEAAGRPRLVWFDCGHYSAVGYLLTGIRQTAEFLAAP